jgi:hypothetical protein
MIIQSVLYMIQNIAFNMITQGVLYMIQNIAFIMIIQVFPT